MAKEEITKAPAMGVFELAPDVTREEMQAVFFDTNALRVPSYRLYQLNAKGQDSITTLTMASPSSTVRYHYL